MPAEYPVLYGGDITGAASAGFAGLAFQLAKPFLDEDLDDDSIREIISASFDFDIPLRAIKDDIYALELFHGPTLAFKDIGARFMARLMAELNRDDKDITILVATSGDTGGAVASGFHRVKNTRVVVLYPEGKVSRFQEKQFTSLGDNIDCLAVDGNFDDCQRMVKEAFMDNELRAIRKLTSANSINIGRWLPQSFYYSWGVLKWKEERPGLLPEISVPSGNYGNLTAGMLAHKTGTPCSGFIAASNINNAVPRYLASGLFEPAGSVETITSAMDVGNPSNFERLMYLGGTHENIKNLITAFEFNDSQIFAAIKRVYDTNGYMLDPHSAAGYLALEKSGQPGFFIATAHPVKFTEVLPPDVSKDVRLPDHFREFGSNNFSVRIPPLYSSLRDYLLNG